LDQASVVNYYIALKLLLNFNLVWISKTATRLAEATMFSFTPTKQFSSSNWIGTVQKISNSRSISFSYVVKNGSQYQHVAQQVTLDETTTSTPHVQVILASQMSLLFVPLCLMLKLPLPSLHLLIQSMHPRCLVLPSTCTTKYARTVGPYTSITTSKAFKINYNV